MGGGGSEFGLPFKEGFGVLGSVGCRALGFKVLWIIGSFKACKALRLGRLRFDVRFCGASGFWALDWVLNFHNEPQK